MPLTLEPPTEMVRQAEARVHRLEMEASYAEFVRGAWPILEPGRPLLWNWHLDGLAALIEALYDGRLRNVLSNFPPRCMKSLMWSAMLPAWVWTKDPTVRFLYSSYAEKLSVRDSGKTRDLVLSPWYQARWGDKFQLRRSQNQKIKFETTATGYRLATSVGGSNTGEGGDWIIVDDAHNVEEAESDLVRVGTVDWWNHTMPTRVNDPQTARRVVNGQRVHEDDISGNILEKFGTEGDWVHYCLPMEFEPDRKCRIVRPGFAWEDPRTQANELLWPTRFPQAYVDGLKAQMGEYEYAAQEQQRPAPGEGGIFKRIYWRFWHWPDAPLPPVKIKAPDGSFVDIAPIPRPWSFDRECQAWDMTFKEMNTSDYVAGHHYGKLGSQSFLLHRVHDRMDFLKTQDEVQGLAGKFQMAGPIKVEDTANGPAILSSLGATVPGLAPASAAGGIEAKAQAFAYLVRAGNVILPHPDLEPWVWGFIHEFAVFNKGRHDDDIAAWSHGMEELYGLKKPAVPITPEYSAKFFVSEADLTPIPGIEAFRFWYAPDAKDGTPWPTCILGQVLPAGQIRILDCVQLENESLDALIDKKVTPVLHERWRGVWRFRDVGNFKESKHGSSPITLQQVVSEKLKGSVEPWEDLFENRINAIKTILGQTNRLVINRRVSQGERELLCHEALAGGFAFEADKHGQLSGLRPQKGNKYTAIGECLGGGLGRIFVRKPQPQKSLKQQQAEHDKQQQKAKGYSVKS